jgi:hypothetical protein
MIPLGPGALPNTAHELSARIESGIRASLDLAPSAPLRVDSSHVSPAEIAEIAIDATGVAVDAAPGEAPQTGTRTGDVVVRRLRLSAAPVHITGMPVTLHAELDNLSGNWAQTAHGDLWITASESPSERPTSGGGTVSVAVADAERFAHDQLAEQLRARGLQLKSFDLAIAKSGPTRLSMTSHATVSKSFLSAKVTATGTGTLDDDLTLRISDAALSSSNAMVSAMIAPFSGMIEKWNGRAIRLADFVFAGITVRSVEVEVGDTVEMRVTLGSTASG